MHCTVAGGVPAVGDQFVMYAWKGMTYVVANSSSVLTQDLTIHVGSDMAIAELDGAGAHLFRRVDLVPRAPFIISSNADAFHSADVDTAATLDHCHFRAMLDDFMNFQTTLLLGYAVNGSSLTLVNPHVSDQSTTIGDDGKSSVTDDWYGTTEPLRRVQAGEELIFYDSVHFAELGRVRTRLHRC